MRMQRVGECADEDAAGGGCLQLLLLLRLLMLTYVVDRSHPPKTRRVRESLGHVPAQTKNETGK